MKTLITITIFALTLSACSKITDYSYLNTDRRPMVIRISERYTDNPLTWIPFKVICDTLPRDTRASDYAGIKPDTLRSTCSIDKIDSNFKIEIRKYIIQ